MIITVKVELLFGGFSLELSECIKIVEIESTENFEDLHLAIQQAIDFDNDHLYEFFIANSIRSRNKVRFDDENQGLWEYELGNIFPLPKGKSLFYMFDYGDSWHFKISRTRHKLKENEVGIIYPRVIDEIGVNPEQYPEYEL